LHSEYNKANIIFK